MTETQADIMEIKQTLKQMQEDIDLLMKQRVREDVYFNTFLKQYDAPPLPMTQACSYEDQMKSIENYNKYWETDNEQPKGNLKELMKRASEEHKEVLDYLKDK